MAVRNYWRISSWPVGPGWYNAGLWAYPRKCAPADNDGLMKLYGSDVLGVAPDAIA